MGVGQIGPSAPTRSEPPSVLGAGADCGRRLFTAKLTVMVHYLPHQLLDHFDRGTRCSGQKRDLGDPSLALSDGATVSGRDRLSRAAWPSPTVQPSRIRRKLDASVTIRQSIPTPVQ